jgi:hypothetical protein
MLAKDSIVSTAVIGAANAAVADAARNGWGKERRLSGHEVGDSDAYTFDITCYLTPRDQWEGKLVALDAVSHPEVQPIECTRSNSDQDFIGTWFGAREIHPL